MVSVTNEPNGGGKPPEPEPAPAQDGDPGRSRPENSVFSGGARLVADDAQEFEEQHLGISLACDPTAEEIYDCMLQAENPGTGKKSVFLKCLVFFLLAFAVWIFTKNVPSALAVAVLSAAWIAADVFLPRRRLRSKAGELAKRHGGEIDLTIYPEHIVLPGNGREREIPLDGTLRLFKTATAFALLVPPKELDGSPAEALLIIPLRCVDAGVLPYVEAMLTAGARPAGSD